MPRRTPDPNEGHGLPLPLEQVLAIVTRSCEQYLRMLGPAGVDDAVVAFVEKKIESGKLAREIERRALLPEEVPWLIRRFCHTHCTDRLRERARDELKHAPLDEHPDVLSPDPMSEEAAEWLDGVVEMMRDRAHRLGLGLAWSMYHAKHMRMARAGETAATTRELAEAHGVPESTVRAMIAQARRVAVDVVRDAILTAPSLPLAIEAYAEFILEDESKGDTSCTQ
jgi:hypothetical protein